MARRIWVVSELYYPEDAATGYFLTGIAEGLAEQNHDVHVICGQPSYWARGTRAPRREKRNGVNLLRCRGTTLNQDNILLRLINLLSITLSMFLAALLHIRRGDLVVVVTNPPCSPLAIALVTRIRRARYVIRVDRRSGELSSPGPVLFRQQRPGRGVLEFAIFSGGFGYLFCQVLITDY